MHHIEVFHNKIQLDVVVKAFMVYRHFGPETLRHHRDGSKMSGQFGTGAEVSIRQFSTSAEVSIQHFGTSAELSAVMPLFNV